MMQDDELFTLCKSVYEKTGWDGDKRFAFDDTYADKWLRYIADFEHKTREWNLKDMIPLYTSDYLLEKLPHEVEEYTVGVVWDKNVDSWRGEYGDNRLHLVHADTPLKALLKLTLALAEAGELK
jgi:hypothetical protein